MIRVRNVWLPLNHSALYHFLNVHQLKLSHFWLDNVDKLFSCISFAKKLTQKLASLLIHILIHLLILFDPLQLFLSHLIWTALRGLHTFIKQANSCTVECSTPKMNALQLFLLCSAVYPCSMVSAACSNGVALNKLIAL